MRQTPSCVKQSILMRNSTRVDSTTNLLLAMLVACTTVWLCCMHAGVLFTGVVRTLMRRGDVDGEAGGDRSKVS